MPLLTTKEIAEFLHVKPKSIGPMMRRGLPFRRIGRNNRFDLAEVNAWTKENAEHARQPELKLRACQ